MTILHVPVTFSNVAEWVRRAAGAINQLIGALASYLPLTGGTLTGDLSVPDEAYGVGWNGSLEVPTKNALYDKIETISGGGVSDGDKGDIVVSSSGAVWEFDTGVVTAFAKTFLDDANAGAVQSTLGLVIGTNVQAFDADLAALAANSTDGLWAHTGAGTGAARTLTAPAAGLTISNPAGIAGNPTFALANDLSALEGLGSTGLAARTASDTWAQRTITAGNTGTTIVNGDGVSGNPTVTSGVWSLAGTGQTATGLYDFAVDGAKATVEFTGLSSFNELLIVVRGLSYTNSGQRALQVSVDNGSSWFTSSGDYVAVDNAGVESNATALNLHATASASARNGFIHLVNTKGAHKVAKRQSGNSDAFFVASSSDINAVRITNTGAGNTGAGTVRVYAR